MKSLQELTQMADDERRAYLEQHKVEITPEWLQAAKEKTDALTCIDPGQAVRLVESVLQAAQVRCDPLGLALACWALGNAHMMDDRPREAIACFEQAIQLYKEMGCSLDVARVELSRMAAETDWGYPDRALELGRRIGPIFAASPEAQDHQRLAKLAGNSGIALELRGDYEEALAAYKRKQEIVRELVPDDDVQVARAKQNLAVALTRLNRFDEAEEAYRQALAVLEAHEVVSDVARAYTNLGWMHDLAGHDEQAARAFARTRDWLARLSDEESLQVVDLLLFELRWCLKRDPAAVITEAARLRQAYAERSFSFAQEAALLEARARLQTGDTVGARRVCIEVEQTLDGRSLAGLLWQVYYLIGQAWQQEGDRAQACARYEKALEMVERDQRRIADIELRASALSDKLAVYQDLAALLVQEHEYDAALQVIERSKARALVDALQTRLEDILPRDRENPAVQRLFQELGESRADLDCHYRQQESELGSDVRSVALDASADVAHLERAYVEKARELSRLDPGYGTVLGTYVASTIEIREALPHGALLVEYYAAQAQLYVLVLAPDGAISHYPLGDLADIERLVEQLPHRSLKSPDERVWTALYDRLVAPWASLLRGVRHLVVVPDGALHYVPFHALRCQRTGRYLIEDCEVSYAPSATLLALTARMRPVRRGVTLALGYDGGPLTLVPAEMGVIASAFSGLILFTGDQASRKRLETYAPQADVIHIAAHGDFRPAAPLFSFIALADGRWQVVDVYRQRLSASLVTLGACLTGRGRLTGSDLIGFAHALFYAGAQAVMASLWPVHDASTATLMAVLYRGIRQGQRKVAALRQAQLALLRSDEWNDPLYWAPFCLIGADGIVGVAGLVRSVRHIVENSRGSEQLSLASRVMLLDCLTRMVEAYDKSGDAGGFADQLARVVEELPELRTLLATMSGSPLDLDQAIVQTEQVIERLMAWRWLSAEQSKEVGQGGRSANQTAPLQPPTWNETIEEAQRLKEALSETISEARRISVPAFQGPSREQPLFRYSDVSFPSHTKLGQAEALRVAITLRPTTEETVLLTLSPPPDESESLLVDSCVVVSPLDFELESPNVQTITVPLDADSAPVVFKLVPKRVGRKTVAVEFFQNTRYLGRAEVETTVEESIRASHTMLAHSALVLRHHQLAPDLTIYIKEIPLQTGSHLYRFFLLSPIRELNLNFEEADEIELRTVPETYFEKIFVELNKRWQGACMDEEVFFKRLNGLGASLYDQLFPEKLKRIYWERLRDRVETIQIVSADPWIPWELIRPYHPDTLEEDGFLCEQFAMTRWLAGLSSPDVIDFRRLALVVVAPGLPYAMKEAEALRRLSDVEVKDIPPSLSAVYRLLETGGFNGLHFACHGEYDCRNPDQSAVLLEGNQRFRPNDIAGKKRTFGRNEPLVFLNACETGRMGLSLTGLGGWARAFVQAGASGFVGPIWKACDEAAFKFAIEFYGHLLKGKAVAEAARLARRSIRRVGDPTWLAYTVYANPLARLSTEKPAPA